MSYRIIKTGLTLASKVWKEGDVISDEQAKELGVDVWFEETKGVTWAGHFMVEASGMVKGKKEELGEEQLEDPKDILAAKGLTAEQFSRMTWKEQAKAFGPKLASTLKKYVKSNN